MSDNVKRVTVDVLTNATGDFSVNTPNIGGIITQIMYEPDDSAGNRLASAADIDIVGSVTGIVLLNADNFTDAANNVQWVPVQDSVLVDGAAGDNQYLFTINEPLTITIAAGGNTKSGKIHLWYV